MRSKARGRRGRPSQLRHPVAAWYEAERLSRRESARKSATQGEVPAGPDAEASITAEGQGPGSPLEANFMHGRGATEMDQADAAEISWPSPRLRQKEALEMLLKRLRESDNQIRKEQESATKQTLTQLEAIIHDRQSWQVSRLSLKKAARERLEQLLSSLGKAGLNGIDRAVTSWRSSWRGKMAAEQMKKEKELDRSEATQVRESRKRGR